MGTERTQEAGEFAALVTRTAQKLASAGEDAALASAVGTALQQAGRLDVLSRLGYRKLTDFIREQCPNLSVEHLPGGKGVLIRYRIPETRAELSNPVKAGVANLSPAEEGAAGNFHVSEEQALEEVTPVAWSPRLTEWLEVRYPSTDDKPTANEKPKIDEIVSQFEAGAYAAIVSSLKRHLPLILSDSKSVGVTPSDRTIIAACCRADAELAAESGLWELAADLLLAALEIVGDDAGVVIPPFRYAQVVATSQLGAEAFQLGPDELAKIASASTRRALCVAMGRAEAVRPYLAEQILGRASKLFFAVREAVIADFLRNSTGDAQRKRAREVEFQAFQILGDRTRDFQTKVISLRNVLIDATGNALRTHAASFVGLLGKGRLLLYPNEEATLGEIQPLLTQEFEKYLSTCDAHVASSLESLAFQSKYAQALVRVADKHRQSSWLFSCVVAPLEQRLARVVQQTRRDASLLARPELQLRRLRRKYPLERVDHEISIPVEVQNTGPGMAESATLLLGDLPADVKLCEEKIDLGPIARGSDSTRTLRILLGEPAKSLRIPVKLQYRDVFGETFETSDEFVLEAQTGDPDWDALLGRAPYTLQPVENPTMLRGRAAHLTKLLINVATVTSTVVWGQKRVGKTSLARVLYNELKTKGSNVVLYIRKGDIAGYDEGVLARDLAERVIEAIKASGQKIEHVTLPSVGEFGGRLTRLARVFEGLRNAGILTPIVLILDEFDELNPAFYRGQRGDNFFGTLRALSECKVAFVFVGSERMPTIFRRFAQLLNKFDLLRVDTIEDQQDLREIIEEPVRGYVEFDREATELVAHLSGGNPYYVNLLCSRLLHLMVTARRTHIDAVDVRRTANALAEEPSTIHWSHLWEEGDAEDEAERERRRSDAALVLSAFSEGAVERGVRLADVASFLERECEGGLPAGLNCETTLETLVGRRVLATEGVGAERRYNMAFNIFRLWVSRNGRAQLLLPQRTRQAPVSPSPSPQAGVPEATPIVVASDFPISDDALIPISEGLYYRGKAVDAMQIKQWLRQFHDDARIILAFKLIKALRSRWYFDDAKLSLALDKAYDRGLKLAKEAGVIPNFVRTSRSDVAHFRAEQFRRDSFPGVIANLYVSYFGDGLKSGASVARSLKKEKRISSAGNLERAAEWLNRAGDINSNKFVLVVDDFVGSGFQVSKEIKQFLKANKTSARVREAMMQRRLVYVPLWAFVTGVQNLKDELPFLRVEPVALLDDSDQVFAAGAEIFDSDEERKIAEAFCRHIGEQLYRDYPLGWDNLQAAVVFPDTVPNATLPILWCSGIVDEREWRPLFPR